MTDLNFQEFNREIQTAVDKSLRQLVEKHLNDFPMEYQNIFAYQLGWSGEGITPNNPGKRIRPLLLSLGCHACGGNWENSHAAACSIELMHNFSLIHDDIQDQSETRRSKPTVWVKWGMPLAINAGDAMLTLSLLAIFQLAPKYPDEKIIKSSVIIQNACLELTRGQHLDIEFEKKEKPTLSEYFLMTRGKTSSLFSACLEVGSLLGNSNPETQKKYKQLGEMIGMAFQVQDDWLGIWGEPEKTGKSISSDIISRKKTYPILLGIENNSTFAEYWIKNKEIDTELANSMSKLLVVEGIEKETKKEFDSLYHNCTMLMEELGINNPNMEPLQKSVLSLLDRIY